MKDNLNFYNSAYKSKESLCSNNNLKQELFRTKRMYLDHLLYLIEIKEKIKTGYQVNIDSFDVMIKKYLDDIDKDINKELGDDKHIDI